MTEVDLPRTRRALHAVGELVLAGPQYRASGTIKLRVSPGGFRTWAEPALAVVGTDLVGTGGRSPSPGARRASWRRRSAWSPVRRSTCTRPAPASTTTISSSSTPPLRHTSPTRRRGDAALRLLAPDLEPVLWPEHFDVGIRVDDVNYGVSPGDDYLAEPYAYVGVDPVPADDPYWNAPFGTAVPMSSFVDATGLHDFYVEARQHRR